MSQEIRRAYQSMCTSLPGSYTTMAQQLGISETALEARIYERKGQKVSVREAMAMQDISERTDFAEAVASISGGVFIKLPETEIIDDDIKETLIRLGEEVGQFYAEHREALDDGLLTKAEKRRLDAAVDRIAQLAAASVMLAVKFGTRNGMVED